ncbi:hypothetical protein LNP74_32605 [Klebsiella pneumoniae subsp. pneumoniae]|nr:hypothetical protein [Klebsiella pneumoniae subsp. pneumoniae]
MHWPLATQRQRVWPVRHGLCHSTRRAQAPALVPRAGVRRRLSSMATAPLATLAWPSLAAEEERFWLRELPYILACNVSSVMRRPGWKDRR